MGKDIQWATIAFLGLLSTKGLGSSDQWKNEAWARDRNIHYTSPEMWTFNVSTYQNISLLLVCIGNAFVFFFSKKEGKIITLQVTFCETAFYRSVF